MNLLLYVTRALIFAIILFGIIDIPNDIKEAPRVIFFLFLSATLLTYILMRKHIITDICVIISLFISSIGFTNYLSDLIDQPIIVAADCEGHEVMSLHGVYGIVYGSLLSLILAFIYFRFPPKTYAVDRVMAFLCLGLLVLAMFNLPFTQSLNNSIDRIKTPVSVLPEGC